MIIIYPIGIPALYFRLLFRKRHELKHRNDNYIKKRRKDVKKNKIRTFVEANAINKTDDNALKRSTQMFKFLYDSYKPQYWYFEIVETTRRLTLTAVLSVVASGSSSQIVCGILLSVMYMKIYAYYQPYSLEESSILAELAQYQIFFSFFGSLIIQNTLLPPGFHKFVGVLMILLNLSTSLLAAYFEYRSSLSEAAEAEAEESIENDNKITNSDNNYNSDNTLNPLQHRIAVNNDDNNSSSSTADTDIEMASFDNNNSINNNHTNADDDTNDRESYVKQIVTKFESNQLVLRQFNNNNNNNNNSSSNNNNNNSNNDNDNNNNSFKRNDDYDSDDDV